MDGLTLNAFKAFDVLDIVLLLLAIAAGALIVLVALDKLDESLHRHVESLGGIAAVAVVFRMLVRPGDIDLSLRWGDLRLPDRRCRDLRRAVPQPDREGLTTSTCSSSAPWAP